MNAHAIEDLILRWWPVVTGVLTIVIGWKSDAAWADLVERQRWLAGLIQLARALGFDVPGVFRALRMIFASGAKMKEAPARGSAEAEVQPTDPKGPAQ